MHEDIGRPEAVLDVRATRVSGGGGEVRLPIIAAPGGGKGTQGKRLAAKSVVQHVSSGDAEARAGTPVGRELAACQERHAADAQRSRMA